jgi:hypothetical protein
VWLIHVCSSQLLLKRNNTHRAHEVDGSPRHQQALHPAKKKKMNACTLEHKSPQTNKTLKKYYTLQETKCTFHNRIIDNNLTNELTNSMDHNPASEAEICSVNPKLPRIS